MELASLESAIYRQNRHFGYKVKYSNLTSLACENWSGNRPCDMSRVDEMVDAYIKGAYIPPMLHLAKMRDTGTFVCYDGNHRREVFERIDDGTLVCIVDVMINATDEEIFEEYCRINSSIQVPSLYLDYRNDDVERGIQNIVEYYCDEYKNFTSTSSRCKRPHFNRDLFIDNLWEVYKQFDGITVGDMERALMNLNDYYRENIHLVSSILQSAVDKSRQYGLWLFVHGRLIPVEDWIHKGQLLG